MTDLSVIVPVHNEVDNLEPLVARLRSVLSSLKRSYEIVLVDDGSDDGSVAVIERLASRDPAVKAVQLQRQFGQTAALAAGFDHSQGSVVVTIDADLQNDPADIPTLLQTLEIGYDVVSGWRMRRAGGLAFRRLPSRMANWVIRRALNVTVHDVGCTLKAYRRPIVAQLNLYGEMHRFLPVLAMWVGARVTEVPVVDHPRVRGRSKYNLVRTFKVLLDLLTLKFLVSFGTRPSYVFGGAGMLLLVLGIGMGALVAVRAMFWHGVWVSPMLFLMAIALICGLQCLLMGILAEFVVRLYHEGQRRPVYLVKPPLHSPPTT